MTRIVGYVHGGAPGRDSEADIRELATAGAGELFTEEGTAHVGSRPVLRECLHALQAGDTLLVTTAADIASTVKEFLTLAARLTASGVTLRSLHEPALSTGADGVSDSGQVYVALEGLRRRLTSAQTRAGMAEAAREGRRPGRPTVMTPERIAMALELRRFDRSISHIARVLGVSANAVQRALAQNPPTEPH